MAVVLRKNEISKEIVRGTLVDDEFERGNKGDGAAGAKEQVFIVTRERKARRRETGEEMSWVGFFG